MGQAVETVTAVPDRPPLGGIGNQSHARSALAGRQAGRDAGHNRNTFLLESCIEQVGHHRRTLRTGARPEDHADQPHITLSAEETMLRPAAAAYPVFSPSAPG